VGEHTAEATRDGRVIGSDGPPPVDWSVVTPTPTAPGSVPRPVGNRPLALADLTDLVGAPVVGDPALTVRGVTHASGDVQPGDLYAALPGARTHGARYTADAASR
jgi:UDP-N-acetylmuramoyl-L-alanyl-D-glutamate--2,6-diaminopimelate ligase